MEDQVIVDGLRKRIRAFEDVIDADQLPFQPGDDFMANPGLHFCLYINVLFSILSWITAILLLQPRFDEFEQKSRIFVLVLVTFFTVMEVIRLYVGLAGNKGKIRLMILFLILTVLMLLCSTTVVFTRLSTDFTAVECNLFLGFLLLLALEWVFGFLGLRTMKRML
ncbi:transmembrane protein 17-like [Heterodontus francisci]|uniref:transmembrane protein 17-like n=1 Tax=Heterodontus francisci TaxID=7792 RepID=UPI00355C369F